MSDGKPMTLNIRVTLKPFQVPNYVNRLNATIGDTGIPVAELDDRSLQAMAEQWLDGLYKKAGRANPFTTGAPKP